MSDRLSEIRERLEAATPGPWEYFGEALMGSVIRGGNQPSILGVAVDPDESQERRRECMGKNWCRDAHFIANAPSDIRWLLERVEALERENGGLRKNYIWAAKSLRDAVGTHVIEDPSCLEDSND